MTRIRNLVVLILLITSAGFVTGQEKDNVTAILMRLFSRLKENYTAGERLYTNDSIRNIIDSYSQSDTVFSHAFRGLRYLGQVTSPDSLVKIITWNLIIDEGESKYFCFLVKRAETDGKNKVYRLSASYEEDSPQIETIYTSTDWYGSIYYDIRPFYHKNRRSYVLLGLDYGNSFITRKIIDVLSFDANNEIRLGLPCFVNDNLIKPRIVFEYASTAVMSLRFETDSMIVFDHLSPFSPELKDNRQFYGPDFSFDSFNFEKGYWYFRSDIDIRNKE